VQADAAAGTAFDPVQNLIDARPIGQAAELGGEELLQRLAAPLGAALERGVHVVRDITYEQVRHAYIMLSPRAGAKSACRRPGCALCVRTHARVTGPESQTESQRQQAPGVAGSRWTTTLAGQGYIGRRE
jgi:hypothetical protein